MRITALLVLMTFLISGSSACTEIGEQSQDLIRGRGGNDVLYGGDGDDTCYQSAGDEMPCG